MSTEEEKVIEELKQLNEKNRRILYQRIVTDIMKVYGPERPYQPHRAIKRAIRIIKKHLHVVD